MASVKNKADLMEELFIISAKALINKLRSGDATPGDVKNAIQFLKDNNVNCDAKKGPPDLMLELLDELPFGDEVN